MEKVHARFLICLLAAGTAVAFALPADALSCTQTCGGDCTGSCTINSISCSVACKGGGCPGGDAECYEYGEVVACHHSLSTKCKSPEEEEGPPGGPETQGFRVMEQSQWAVVTFRTDDVNPVNGDSVQLIAASTPRYGGVAIDNLIRSSEESFDLKNVIRERSRLRGDTVVPIPRSLPIFERVEFMVAPARACEHVEFSIPSEAPSEVKGSAFFRVIAGADGEVSAVSPLYAEEGTNLKALSRFLREEGQVDTAVGMPIEAFLYLRVDDAGVSYIVGGGSRLF
jgi:hypothetical protein